MDDNGEVGKSISAPNLDSVYFFDESGHGQHDKSLPLEHFVDEAAATILNESGLDLSDDERQRMIEFATDVGSRALEAAASHMGLRGWIRMTFDTPQKAARTYGILGHASWYPELTVKREDQVLE